MKLAEAPCRRPGRAELDTRIQQLNWTVELAE